MQLTVVGGIDLLLRYGGVACSYVGFLGGDSAVRENMGGYIRYMAMEGWLKWPWLK